MIAQSRTKAESDVAANSESGAYASAAMDNGAYNIHGYAREIVTSFPYARHWAIISASYHQSTDARDSYELTSQALNLAGALGAQAGRCYMNQYLP